MNKHFRLLLLLCLPLCVASCGRVFGGQCKVPQAYAMAEELPPLKIPVGLQAPNTRDALKIPELNEPEAPRAETDPCLEEPPAYSTSTATPAAAAPAAAAPNVAAPQPPSPVSAR